jgi:MoxR-like ATPase
MADTIECRETLSRFLKARIPFIAIRTPERRRAIDLLREVANEIQTSFTVHTLSGGLRDLVTDQSVSDDRSLIGALDVTSQSFLSRANLTAIFTDVQDLGDDTPTARQFADVASVGERKGGSIVVITTQPVWSALQRQGMSIALDPPNEGEMETIIRESIEPYRGQLPIEWEDAEYKEASTILAGITRLEAENVIATILAGGAVRKADMRELTQAKDRIFSDISGIERVTLRENEYAVGGLDGLRSWLDREREFAKGDTTELKARGMRPPRGVLLVGVPGCGKSLSAKAIASSWELPLYRLDFANVFGQYVGQSEARLKDALASADHVAPCVLWIDEIEKGLSGAGSDSSGVTNRLVGQFLFWLQESTARVFVVATANDVSKLPPELLRRGRFDEMFFVDLPVAQERKDIVKIYLDRYTDRPVEDALADELVALSDGFCGADIESACREVGKESIRMSNGNEPDDDFLRLCFRNIVPLIRTNPERIEQIREWGRERAVPAGAVHEEPTPVGPGRRVVIH